jgi:hypothetical protein
MSVQRLDRVVGQVEQRLLEDAQNHCDRGIYGDGGRAQDVGCHHKRSVVGCLAEEHRHNDPHIEVRGNPAGDHADVHQWQRAALGGGLEHGELADESLVSGIPAKANRNIENITPTMGECCPGPARDGERAHRADAVGEQIEHRR